MGYQGLGSSFENFMFNAVPIFIIAVFIIVFGGIIVASIYGFRTWLSNNRHPTLIERAKVTGKRSKIWSSGGRHSSAHGHGHFHHHTRTQYFITFEIPNGTRQEFQVGEVDYGLIVDTRCFLCNDVDTI